MKEKTTLKVISSQIWTGKKGGEVCPVLNLKRNNISGGSSNWRYWNYFIGIFNLNIGELFSFFEVWFDVKTNSAYAPTPRWIWTPWQQQSHPLSPNRNAVPSSYRVWKNGIIPYVIDDDYFFLFKNKILSSMRDLEAKVKVGSHSWFNFTSVCRRISFWESVRLSVT